MPSPDRSVRRVLAAGAGLAAVGLASLTAAVVVGNRDPKLVSAVSAPSADDAAEASLPDASLQVKATSLTTESLFSSVVQATESISSTPALTQLPSWSVPSANALPASDASGAPSRTSGAPSSTFSPTTAGDPLLRRLHAGPITVSHIERLYTFTMPGSFCTGKVTWTFKGSEGKESSEEVPCDRLRDQLNHKLQSGSNTVSVELSDSSVSQTSSITFDVE